MDRHQREQFDRLLDRVLASLPAVRELLEEAPLIVDDRPDRRMLEELGIDDETEVLCGLHSGTPLTERSLADAFDEPETIHLFRDGIVEEAGGWEAGAGAVTAEIRTTLLHEVGHHFGLEEDDLDALGYA